MLYVNITLFVVAMDKFQAQMILHYHILSDIATQQTRLRQFCYNIILCYHMNCPISWLFYNIKDLM